jgi:hypothetical protein
LERVSHWALGEEFFVESKKISAKIKTLVEEFFAESKPTGSWRRNSLSRVSFFALGEEFF